MDIHAAEQQAVSISLVMWHQMIVVKDPYPEHRGIHAHTHEEDTDKAHHLVEKKIKVIEKDSGNIRIILKKC